MKVLVTGGAGFIGSHITDLLCRQKHRVVVFDNLSFGFREFVNKKAKLIVGDLRRPTEINRALAGIEAVIHMAALSKIPSCIEKPKEAFDINLTGGINLLEAMRKRKIKNIIFSSTAAVYGEPKKIPIKEDDPKFPLQPYGATKLAFEQLLCAYAKTYGFNAVCLRYFNVYGPRDEQIEHGHAVPLWIKAASEGKPIPLYWQGRQIRDYIYVEDVARAHAAVLGLRGFNYFNIGSGRGSVMKDILEEIFRAIGKKAPINDLGERPGDPMRLVADTTKIYDKIGWKPEVSLEKGIKKTVAYYQSSLSLRLNNKRRY